MAICTFIVIALRFGAHEVRPRLGVDCSVLQRIFKTLWLWVRDSRIVVVEGDLDLDFGFGVVDIVGLRYFVWRT